MKEETDGIENSRLVDSSVIISYLFDNTQKEVIESKNRLFMSAITLFEVKKKLVDKNIPKNVIEDKIKYIKSLIISLPLTEEIAEDAVELSKKYDLATADALIYSTSIKNNLILITRDNDFRNVPNVQVRD